MNEVTAEFGFLPVEQIRPNPDQPRENFDDGQLQSLADSIAEVGVLNPVSVRGPYDDEGKAAYYLIDGERRLRATRLAGLKLIPAYVHSGPEKTQALNGLALALVANLQRTDMNPIEEGQAYKRLFENGYSIKEISDVVGRSIPTITLKLKLISFEPEIRRLYAQGLLPIDASSIAAISNLSDEQRVRVVTRLAAKRASGTAIRMTCTRLIRSYDRIPSKKFNVKKDSPAINMSKAETAPSLKVLGAAGQLPQWEVLNTAAQETCQNCTEADYASDVICKECPAVELLKRVVKISTERS